MRCVEALGCGGWGWFGGGVGGDGFAVRCVDVVFVCFEAFLFGLRQQRVQIWVDGGVEIEVVGYRYLSLGA